MEDEGVTMIIEVILRRIEDGLATARDADMLRSVLSKHRRTLAASVAAAHADGYRVGREAVQLAVIVSSSLAALVGVAGGYLWAVW